MTQVIKIDLISTDDAAAAIKYTCEIREAAVPPLKLRGCFESAGELVLIFQD